LTERGALLSKVNENLGENHTEASRAKASNNVIIRGPLEKESRLIKGCRVADVASGLEIV
jgi:hypothetical protein